MICLVLEGHQVIESTLMSKNMYMDSISILHNNFKLFSETKFAVERGFENVFCRSDIL